MTTTVQFETPENITVSYQIAGPGTRYIAWFVDMLTIILTQFIIALVIGAVALLASSMGASISDTTGPIFVIVVIVGFGFFSLAYFAGFELFMNGQTPGKRLLHARVVNERGFSLDAGAVLLRTLFRVVDTIPILWIVPLLSGKVQRFGDMVAGTIVILEEPPTISVLREHLMARDASEVQFNFSPVEIGALRPVDVETVELFLERREQLHPEHRATLAMRIARGISNRLDRVMPPTAEQEPFCEDLLAAYARREARELG
jgi:uncharacterized RDD family membrane protein YckC